MNHSKRKKNKKCHVLKVLDVLGGETEGSSCSLKTLHGGIRIKILHFLYLKIFEFILKYNFKKFLVIENLYLDPYRIRIRKTGHHVLRGN